MILTKVFRATQPKSILDELNRESGRVYSETMVEHWRVYRKHAVWLSSSGEEKYNDYLHPATILHSHSKDAAQQAFAKAVKTTRGCARLAAQKRDFHTSGSSGKPRSGRIPE